MKAVDLLLNGVGNLVTQGMEKTGYSMPSLPWSFTGKVCSLPPKSLT